MFDRILIANRGEIACRVIDTARRLGVETVAVYSDADADARHVDMADQAVRIGPAPVAESYLDAKALIDAALATGAQAIHPGYGFLSENPEFVDAVSAAGLVFIGPSAKAIRAMGLKDAAKALMEKAGIPVVPGYHGANQADDHLRKQAQAIGYPVLIKAVAGGGGKGMRRVDNDRDFIDALTHARSEASAAFGNDAVLIEKFIENPRHIEVQIFGDGMRAVHLFERDCSLQRRHQKVIEEAPAPGMTPDMRAAMGAAAVGAARAVDYAGAGTVEFIVDAAEGLAPDRFWFMEMNTRLQVEHPVTEAVTGIDLVEWQLRVASGEALPLSQDEITLTGHAIEARLYAEDPANGFLPATGTLRHMRVPAACRLETGVRSGDEISPFYDPMIAKIITEGPNRQTALARMERALEGTQIAGLVTNLDFLGRLVGTPEFRAAELDTGLIERADASLTHASAPNGTIKALAAIAALGLDKGGDWQSGFTLWEPLVRDVTLCYMAEEFTARVSTFSAGRFRVSEGEHSVLIEKNAGGWRVDGAKVAASLWRQGGDLSVFCKGTWHFTLLDPLERDAMAGASGNLVLSPMPGLVRKVHVVAGHRVETGAPLLVLEAMKMEHVLVAERDGDIAEVLAHEGAQVASGEPLVRFVEDED